MRLRSKSIILIMLLPVFLKAQLIPISSARLQPLGSTVTVRGVVTNGAELGKIRYFQDGTGGMAAYPGSGSAGGFEGSVTRGDSVEITGTLVDYHGLLEISPILSYAVIQSGLPGPTPIGLDITQISEAYESSLVSFECVSLSGTGSQFPTGNVNVTDFTGASTNVFMPSGHPMIGTGIPDTSITLTCILSQYDDFQLLLRNQSDFSQTHCLYFTEQLSQTNIHTTGFTVSWETNLGTETILHYGKTPYMDSMLVVPGLQSGNSYTFSNLEPGTIYWVQAACTQNGQSIFSKTGVFATQSNSSGEIKIFFNHDINPTYANGFVPDGQSVSEVMDETIARINSAEQTLDIAMYNNNQSMLVNVIADAWNRGVRVRYIADEGTSNTALQNSPPFPVLYGNDSAIMHDKVLVIDADIPDKCWVMSGSMNWTGQNINNDFNNTLFIQDQSLARAYELEFEEMWGSEGPLPDAQQARFGAGKLDNTPHYFMVGNRPVELWFSPSDQTTSHIVESVYDCSEEALFALFSFTKDDIADALVDAHFSSIPVRGIIENVTDNGQEYDYLRSQGIDCQAHYKPGEFHHKYAVFDANGTDPVVLTGSHNWSFSAETVNDENTLIIHDYELASLYKAEFEQRWQELTVQNKEANYSGMQLYPNPAIDVLTIKVKEQNIELIQIRDVLGNILISQSLNESTTFQTIHIEQLPAGTYLICVISQHGLSTLPFQKI